MSVAETIAFRAPHAESWRRAALLLTALILPAGYAAAGALILLLASAVLAVRHGALWHRTPLDRPLALLAFSLILSAALSPYVRVSAVATALFMLLLILAYGATAASLGREPAFLTPLLGALGAGTMAAAVWAIVGYLVTGRPAHTAAIGYNAVGTTLATGLPILLGLGVRAEGRGRLAASAAAAVTLVGLALTFARGAWLGAAVGLFLFIALLPRPARRPVLALLSVVLLAGALALANAAGALEERAGSASVSDRVAMWRASLAMVRDRPLLGSGLNTFGLLYPRYKLPDDRASGQPFAHNIFLNVAAEAGLLGLAAFVAVLLTALVLSLRWLRRAGGAERVAAASVLGAAAALMVHQQVDGTAISFHIGFSLWILLGIMAARGATTGRG